MIRGAGHGWHRGAGGLSLFEGAGARNGRARCHTLRHSAFTVGAAVRTLQIVAK